MNTFETIRKLKNLAIRNVTIERNLFKYLDKGEKLAPIQLDGGSEKGLTPKQ